MPNFGVRFVNFSGAAFTSFSIDMVMEQWRSGGRTGLDSLYCYTSVNNSLDSLGFVRITTGNWTRQPSADMVSKVTLGAATALDGNLPANRQYYRFTFTGITVNTGDTLWIRWQDPNAAGSDDGLSIDDFRFSVTTVLPVSWKWFTATANENSNILKWSTASETNNSHFEVQRSMDGKKFETVGKVYGKGTTSKVSSYSFTDEDFLTSAAVYYRLKQIDLDGKFEYSKVVSVQNNEQEIQSGITTTLPNPFGDELNITVQSRADASATIQVIDMIGKTHKLQTQQFIKGGNKVEINTEDMPNGIYFVRVNIAGEVFTQKIVKR